MIALHRKPTICSSPKDLLLDAVKTNDVDGIKSILNSQPNLLTHTYEHPYNKTILLICCELNGILPHTVQTLIDYGADLNDAFCQSRAIHLAAQNANYSVLEVIVKNTHKDQLNVLADGDNALHALIRYADVRRPEFLQCAQLLLRAGVDVNQGDQRNVSPILLAANKGYGQLVHLILDTCTSHVDLDTHKIRGKNARDIIRAKNLYDKALPSSVSCNNNTDPLLQLFTLLNDGNDHQPFLDLLGKYPELSNESNGQQTLLQKACEKMYTPVVQKLLEHGADPNSYKSGDSPIEIAAECGHVEILKMLLDIKGITITCKALCSVLRLYNMPKLGPLNHEACARLILENVSRLDMDINGVDEAGNTCLHYACRNTPDEVVGKLLEMGASLAARNPFTSMPIDSIKASTLQKHLDSCIKFDHEKHNRLVTFDYRTLLPPSQFPRQPETSAIFQLCNSPDLKHFLQHPTVATFLLLKWHSIRWIFVINLCFYMLFVASLIAYVFLSEISWLFLCLTTAVLLVRELAQMTLSRHYWSSTENYIECILIGVVLFVLFIGPSSLHNQMSAIAILLSTFELVLMLGQHPSCSTHVAMFKAVSRNFFLLLSWYSMLILAFALSFSILFANSTDEFRHPGSSLFKTFVMLTGEFEAGSIDFQTYPITSRCIFAMFVFMITIILLNLLNGLAVSDTQAIINEADVVSLMARAKHIYYVESMLSGTLSPGLFGCFCCCFSSKCKYFENEYLCSSWLAKKARIFCGKNYDFTILIENASGRVRVTPAIKKRYNFFYVDQAIVRRVQDVAQNQEKFNQKITLEKLYEKQLILCSAMDKVKAKLNLD